MTKEDKNQDAEAALKAKDEELAKAKADLEASKKEVEELQKQKNVSAKAAQDQALSPDGVYVEESNQSDPHRKVAVFINSKDHTQLVHTPTTAHPFKHVTAMVNGKEFVVPCDQHVEVPVFVANQLGQGETAKHPNPVQAEVFKPEVYGAAHK